MDRQEVVEKITGFARKALAKKDIEIAPDARLKDLGMNSSGRLELFTMIEDEWDLMMEEEDQDNPNYTPSEAEELENGRQ